MEGSIEEFYPSNIIYTLPPIEGNLQDIIETEVEGGTQVLFDYGEVATGTSVEFAVGANFAIGRKDGDSFTNVINMYEGESIVGMDTSDPVVLTLISDFVLEKDTITSGNPKANEEVYFELVLVNNGDGGATISEISITDTLPTGLVPDLNYTIIGKDASENFPDTTYDGLEGTWDSSTMNFYLPSYSGEKYVIEVHTLADSRVTPGETLTNTANWTVESEEQNATTADVTIYIDKFEGYLRKNGPNNGSIGGGLQYEIFHGNRGTLELTDYRMTELVPDDFVLEKIKCFSNSNLFDSYSIYVTTTSSPSTEILVAENLVGASEVYDLLEFISDGEKINSVIWTSSLAKVSTSTSRLHLKGYVVETAELDSILINNATLTANSTLGDVDLTATKETTLDDRSGLEVRKSLLTEEEFFFPLEEFTVSLMALARNYQTVDPIFADLLPPELVYIPGNAYYLYYSGFTRTLIDSRSEEYDGPLPEVTVIPDFSQEGETLLRFDFSGFTLEYRDVLMVYFTTAVAIGAEGSFTNIGYLGNPTDNGIVIGDSYLDTLDLDGDGFTDETISQSDPITGAILYTREFSIDKYVKGTLDSEFSLAGTTTPGGNLEYKLYVTDNQDVALTNIEIVDILPHIGDTGVVLVDEERGSQFPVYYTGEISVEIVNIVEGTVVSDPDVTIEYSESYDPIRYNLLGEIIGTGTWSTDITEDLEEIKSIKITTGENLVITPYERLIVTFSAKAPEGVPVGEIAYNSFSVKGDTSGSETISSLLPTEPTKVSITIVEDILGSIGQFVWNDLNEDGIWDDDEPGINGVTVELYDSTDTLLSTTITSDSYDGTTGYYVFSNLTAGEYRLKFIAASDDVLTIQNLDSSLGSKPDPSTGFTEIFTLTTGEQITDMNAGILVIDDPRVQAINDLLESIALEEVGIQSILNGEGAKIQRAVELDLSTEDLLAVNNSVESMVQRLTDLEWVLKNKLQQTFEIADLS